MKKHISIVLSILLLISIISPVAADELTKVSVDGQVLNFDVSPTIVEGRTLVPLRAIFEVLGAEIDWDSETRTVTGIKGSLKVVLTVDSKVASVNNQQIELEVPGTIVDGRTMVPARFIAESLGASVGWDADTRTVLINSSVPQTTGAEPPTELKVHFIDVGQADSIFIDYGDYDILIDAGNNSDGDLVVNYLKSLNTDDIEVMVATHPDEDHIGGLDDVLKAFKVETIIDSGYSKKTNTYADYYNAATNEEGAKFIKDEDMSFDLGNGIKFEVIETGDSFGNNTNNYSVITKLTYNNVKFLFTGDMEKDAEKNILDRDIQADILKVANHGSDSSTSYDFLEKVKPKVAVISAGKDNKYKYPHAKTLSALDKYVDKIYGTWLSGNIIVSTDGKDFSVSATEKLKVPVVQPQPTEAVMKPVLKENTNNNQASSNLIIQSIDLDKEIVVIKNADNKDIDMTGWKLVSVKGNQVYNFPNGFVIKAGTTITVASGKSTGDLKWSGQYIWNNDGDPGELYDSAGAMVSSYPN